MAKGKDTAKYITRQIANSPKNSSLDCNRVADLHTLKILKQ